MKKYSFGQDIFIGLGFGILVIGCLLNAKMAQQELFKVSQVRRTNETSVSWGVDKKGG